VRTRSGKFSFWAARFVTAGWTVQLHAQTTNLVTNSSHLPDVATSAIRMLGSLVFVMALFFGGVWAFKNWRRLTVVTGRPQKLQIIEARSLGNRNALYVVGYEQQRMLVASSGNGVTLLSHLPAGEEESQKAPETTPASHFAQALQQVFSRR
jgi:flagellar biogenesis protein FliO